MYLIQGSVLYIYRMMQWKLHIEKLLKNRLPGESSHRKMLPPERELHVPANNLKNVKISGVLVLIYPEGNDIYTCLILS